MVKLTVVPVIPLALSEAMKTAILRPGRRFDLVRTRANGQPAFGAYLRASDGISHGAGLIVLTL
jgi:hypothetical protein